jgi:tripartite-type tricarboxylate transporter receptor subunit TctC
MKIQRREFLHLAAGAATVPAISRVASAQTYPTRPITMIVAFAAGGPTDVFGRVLAARMRDSLKQPVIIENVSGADGTIGTGRAARAKPDGYTIDLGLKTTHVMVGAVYSLPYDVLNDFEPVSPVVTTPFFLFARKMMPATDLTGWSQSRTCRCRLLNRPSGGSSLAHQPSCRRSFRSVIRVHRSVALQRGQASVTNNGNC